jgi:hypothetical protein
MEFETKVMAVVGLMMMKSDTTPRMLVLQIVQQYICHK